MYNRAMCGVPSVLWLVSCIGTGFRLLAESEQTATMYTLLQTVNYGQAKFLMAVLQQVVDAVVGMLLRSDTPSMH